MTSASVIVDGFELPAETDDDRIAILARLSKFHFWCDACYIRVGQPIGVAP